MTAKGTAACGQAQDGPGQQRQVKLSLALATCVQMFSMCVVTGVSSMLALAPMLVSMYLMLEVGWRALVLLPVFELGGWLLLALWSIGGKWLLIERYQECAVPLWGTFYLRHYAAHLFVLVSGLLTASAPQHLQQQMHLTSHHTCSRVAHLQHTPASRT
jgi:hypothetical protein